MLVVYSNIFNICYDNWYATTGFICNLVRELLACSNVKIKVWIDRQTHFFTFKSSLWIILHCQDHTGKPFIFRKNVTE